MSALPPLLDHLGLRDDTRPLQFLGEAGFLWSYLGRWKEAEATFTALTMLVPRDPTGYLGLAEAHLVQSRYTEAGKCAEQAIKAAVGRDDANTIDRATAARAWIVAAKAALHQKQMAKAIEAFTKAKQLDPDGPSGQHAADMLEQGKLIGVTQ